MFEEIWNINIRRSLMELLIYTKIFNQIGPSLED